MITITGTIESIEDTTKEGHIKKTVLIRYNHLASYYVQFHWQRCCMLDGFKEDEEVEVLCISNAKKSSTGIHHNNLIAQSIKRVNY